MKRWLVLPLMAFFALSFFSACSDDDDSEKITEEKIRIEAYLKISPYQYVALDNGLYYHKLEDGNGIKPINGDFVVFSYTGRTLTNSVFDTNILDTANLYKIYKKSTFYAPLFMPLIHPNYPNRRLIRGVEEGLKNMQEGESARFIIPFSLGYGSSSFSSLPAYSTLIFDIKLEKVVKDPVEYETTVIENYISSKHPTILAKPEDFYFIEIKEGEGELIQDGDVIEVDYTAYQLGGPAFYTTIQSVALNYDLYSPYASYMPESITVGTGTTSISGFSVAAKYMKPGGKARIILPSKHAFGEWGNSSVAPYSPIEIELEIVNTAGK